MISIGSLRGTTSTSELAKIINNHVDVQTASAQQLSEKLTVIIQVKRSESDPHQSNNNRIKVEAEVVLKTDGSKISSQTSQPVTFYSSTPMTQGELLAVSAEMTNQALVLNPKSMNKLAPDIQLQLQKFIPQTANASGISDFAQIFPEVSNSIDQLLKVMSLTQSTLSETLKVSSDQLLKTTIPLEWLNQQNFQYSSDIEKLPTWLKDIPNMSLRNLQTHNLQILESALPAIASALAEAEENPLKPSNQILLTPKQKQISNVYGELNRLETIAPRLTSKVVLNTSHSNILTTSFLLHKNQEFKSNSTLMATFEKIQNWLHVQQRWLMSPESVLANLTSISQMLPDQQHLNLISINSMLEKIWPSYSKISQIMTNLRMESQFSLNHNTLDDHKLLIKLVELIEADEDLSPKQTKLELLHALTLKSGLSEVIQSLVSHSSTDDTLQKIPFISMPIQLSIPDSRAWMQVHIETRPSNQAKDVQFAQVLTLDFETNRYGSIRFDLTFNNGFQNPECSIQSYFEHQHHAQFFSQYEHQLAQRLQLIGLRVNNFQWRKGSPRTENTSQKPNPMFHVDYFV